MGKAHAQDWLQQPCPCGRTGQKNQPLVGADCCGRYLDHYMDIGAPDAESLMRSRYTAFVLGRNAYLLATWHPQHRPETLELEPDVQWLGLEVKQFTPIDETHAEVEFVARSRYNGKATRLHERSRFVCGDDGRWVYVDGDML